MLSFIYRLLARTRNRDEVTLDMLGTFEEARVDAQSRGRWSYFRFAIRELTALLSSPGRMVPGNRWTLIAGCGLAGLTLGAAASYFLPASYTSEAILQIEPPQIPGALLANLDAVDLNAGVDGHGLDLLRQGVTSRVSLAKIVDKYDLYRHERARKPFDVILQEMRKTIRIERTGDFSIRVAFTYWDYPRRQNDNRMAQWVAQELVGQLLDAAFRNQSNGIFQTVEYFKDRTDESVRSWEALNARIRALSPADPHFDRLMLDRELARKEYESLWQKLGEVEGVQQVEKRKQGRNLQLLDPASLPEIPDTSSMEMALYGLGCGLAVGLLAALWQTLRRAFSGLLTPEIAPIH